jgi:2-amino-4-hydroxy-6-hydroxymethyldihydropteridine diphosphokinase
MAVVYLGLGSNIGDRTQHLVDACATLHRHPAITVQAVSSLYHTAPVGVTAQDWFLNAVACLHTTLRPPALLCVTQATERRLGRVTTLRWGPRIIDIDILLYDAIQVHTPYLPSRMPPCTNGALCSCHWRNWRRSTSYPLALGCVIFSRPCPMPTTCSG